MTYTIKLTHDQLEMLIQSIMNENKAWNSIRDFEKDKLLQFIKHDVGYQGTCDLGKTNSQWADLSDSILDNLVHAYTNQEGV